MPETEEIVKVVSQWIRKAENDLRIATLALRTEKNVRRMQFLFMLNSALKNT